MPTAGLDISEDAIRAVELRRDKGIFKLEKHDKREIGDDVISHGNISDRDALVRALTDIRKQNRMKFVRVSLPEEKSYLYHTSVPYVPDPDEMRQSVQFTIEENVPHEPDNVVFDYEVVTEEKVEEGVEVSVVVSVLPIEVVNAYLEVLDASGFRPMSLMVESQAICRAVIPHDDHESHVVLNVGSEKTSIYVVSHATVHFTSTFTTEGGSLSAPVAGEASGAPNQFERSEVSAARESEDEEDEEMGYVEAKLQEIEETEDRSEEPAGREDPPDGEADGNTDMPSAATIAQEANRVCSYWRSHGAAQQNNTDIVKAYLIGHHAFNDQFKQRLSAELDLDVDTANVWVNAFSLTEYIPSIHARDANEYGAAVGLALPLRS